MHFKVKVENLGTIKNKLSLFVKEKYDLRKRDFITKLQDGKYASSCKSRDYQEYYLKSLASSIIHQRN